MTLKKSFQILQNCHNNSSISLFFNNFINLFRFSLVNLLQFILINEIKNYCLFYRMLHKDELRKQVIQYFRTVGSG